MHLAVSRTHVVVVTGLVMLSNILCAAAAVAVSVVCSEVQRGMCFLAWVIRTDGVLISAAECTRYPFRLPRTKSAVWYKLLKI